MTAQEIINLALYDLRDEEGASTRDNALPFNNAITLLNEAINEACRRARLISDRTTAAICSISVVAGTRSYALDSRVIKIKSAYLETAQRVLAPTNVADAACMDEKWHIRTGTPEAYLTDDETGKITLFRKPIANDTLSLAVYRLPLTPISSGSDTPEILDRYHNALASYLVYKVRSIDDSETYDIRKAQAALSVFEAEFGPKRSAWSERFEDTQPWYEDQ